MADDEWQREKTLRYDRAEMRRGEGSGRQFHGFDFGRPRERRLPFCRPNPAGFGGAENNEGLRRHRWGFASRRETTGK